MLYGARLCGQCAAVARRETGEIDEACVAEPACWLGRSRGGRPPAFDAQAYKGRHVVERCFNRLKDFRAVAMRVDKRGHNFLARVILASIFVFTWIE